MAVSEPWNSQKRDWCLVKTKRERKTLWASGKQGSGLVVVSEIKNALWLAGKGLVLVVEMT